MKHYLKPQKSIYFKNKLIEIYKMMWFLTSQNFCFSCSFKMYIFFKNYNYFETGGKLTTFKLIYHITVELDDFFKLNKFF